MKIGYRVVSFSLDTLKAKTLQDCIDVNLEKGSEISSREGIYLGTSEDFCEYYLNLTDDHDLIMRYEYDSSDVIKGDEANDSEIRVSKATLIDARFNDDFMQGYYGYLLDGEESRKNDKDRGIPIANRGDALLIRAMPEQCNSILPMDYAYLLQSDMPQSKIKRVLNDIEEGNIPYGMDARILLKSIEHATTCALYHGNTYRISISRVPAKDVISASNTGEYLYGGSHPMKGRTILTVCENGLVTAPEKQKHSSDYENLGP